MQVHVTFRKLRPTKALKDYAEEKIEKVRKYLEDPITAHIVLESEKDRHRAHVNINAHGIICQGEKTSRDMYASIDGMMDRIEKQLRRHKRAPTGKRHKTISHHGALDALVESPAPETTRARIAREPQVIRPEGVHVKPMSVDEAMLQLERMRNHEFLVFRNDTSDEINVLYKRKDGAYGLIDPAL